jgi:hypothetical protein
MDVHVVNGEIYVFSIEHRQTHKMNFLVLERKWILGYSYLYLKMAARDFPILQLKIAK